MQDRLKFKVYHKPTNKIYNVYGFNDDFVFIDTLDTCEPFLREDCILLQCIGLKDKNGNLIYDGDIVVIVYSDGTEGRKSVVKYGEFNCSCCDGIYGWYFDYGDIRNIEDYIVIGNVHVNRDLLEDKDE